MVGGHGATVVNCFATSSGSIDDDGRRLGLGMVSLIVRVRGLAREVEQFSEATALVGVTFAWFFVSFDYQFTCGLIMCPPDRRLYNPRYSIYSWASNNRATGSPNRLSPCRRILFEREIRTVQSLRHKTSAYIFSIHLYLYVSNGVFVLVIYVKNVSKSSKKYIKKVASCQIR